MLRLKKKKREDDYLTGVCAAARCTKPAVVIDATGRLAAGQVPLCEDHWEARCELEDFDNNAETTNAA